MADSLIDKIKKYVRITNYLGEPRTDEDEEVLSKLIDKNRMFNYEPLNLNDVVQLGLDIGADNIRESIDFYKKLAEEIEIEYIDADMDVIEQPEVDTESIKSENKITIITECYLKRKCFGRSIKARGILNTDGTLTVLKGSDVSEREADSTNVKYARDKFRQYFKNGTLTENITCGSPSNAAIVVFGYNSNGWSDWKDGDGRALQIYREFVDEQYEQNEEIQDECNEVNEDNIINEEYTQGVNEDMNDLSRSLEMTVVPKVGLSDKTLKQISKSTDKIVGAIKELKTTQKKNDETEETVMEIEESSEAYSIEQREEDVIGIPFSRVRAAVERGMIIIYRGVPGCGKTRTANCDAKAIIGKVESNRIKQIDFTENLDYTDTMVGMKQSEDGQWRYVKGSIAKFCEFADRNRDKIFVLILNEFTRANTEAVLGQMFTAMENKYRGTEFTLDSGDKFVCPKNLVILATMNGTDKGVKKLDKATEERFYIIDVKPLWVEWATNSDAFDRLIDTLEITIDSDEYKIVEKLCEIMSNINISCEEGGMLTTDHQIGQRQLMQFVGEKGLNGKLIRYNKETLGIVIEQLLSRVNQLKEMNDSIEKYVDELSKLLERCNE